ncbi:MAG: DUF2183 domain-containing protein [Trueperaceae bacterium]|nr:DUF2183 domain-containing protein [Trueperaceae bacterium]
MSRWKKYLGRSLYQLDAGLDLVRYRLSERFSNNDIVAFPYISYGNQERLLIKGRVLRARSIQPATKDSSFWLNLKNAYKRFDSDEVPYAKVLAHFHEQETTITADDEGFFETWLELQTQLDSKHELIQTVDLDLLDLKKAQKQTRFQGIVMVPDASAQFGIISDLDDTVLQTGAQNILSMLRKVLFGNAYTRLPFDGVAEFYQALHADKNPIFYVSSSPWNLYDVLLEFFDIQDIPVGPLMLRDWGISATEFIPSGHKKHKLELITSILDTYPNLPFILIGDSGQEDPEIYRETVRRYPERILAIYIRDVSADAARDQEIRELAKVIRETGCELLLIPDTANAFEHAKAKGWIS